MKIIFLDIDGVLCTSRSHLSKHGRGGLMDAWDDVGALAIKRACEFGTNVKIVISSTWRKFCLNPRDNSDIPIGEPKDSMESGDMKLQNGWKSIQMQPIISFWTMIPIFSNINTKI
jgi:hypothetical protein